MCLILNIIFLALLAWELNNDYAVLELSGISKKIKRNCIARIALACLLEFIAIMLLYHVFGITSNNLQDYIHRGKV